MIIIGIVFWIVCGILTYGLHFAYLQRRLLDWQELADKSYTEDRSSSMVLGMGGPISLMGLLISKQCCYGFKWK